MENNLLDRPERPVKQKSTSIQLLFSSGIVLVIMLLALISQLFFGFFEWTIVRLLLSFLVIVMSGAGFIFGLTELKLKEKKVLFATILNLVLLIVFLLMAIVRI